MTDNTAWKEIKPTAVLVLSDGTVIEGQGLGATGAVEAEVCFNTALTGYQEILTDPSYDGQIVTFTFPHIGNVGANEEDIEDLAPAARNGAVGAIFKADITGPSNYRSAEHLNDWLKRRGIVAMSGIDTRALTAWIRENGMPNAVLAHDPAGVFDLDDLKKRAAGWHGLEGLDLAAESTTAQLVRWDQAPWVWDEGFGTHTAGEADIHIVAIDFGVKRNILRLFSGLGCRITVMPATTSAEDVMAHGPDGIFLSNGPGDPAATGAYAVPVIQKLIETGTPTFGICLGHQILALALGARTVKMHQGHHGANPPGQGPHDRKGGNRFDESRLCRRRNDSSLRHYGNSRIAVRWLKLRLAGRRQTRVFRPASPGGFTGSTGLSLPVSPVHQPHPRKAWRDRARRVVRLGRSDIALEGVAVVYPA